MAQWLLYEPPGLALKISHYDYGVYVQDGVGKQATLKTLCIYQITNTPILKYTVMPFIS
jgi:hypothetical protein